MNSTFTRLALIAALGSALEAESSAKDSTPREAYNEGAASLQKGNLREAETWLRQSVASQDESLQPPALYNLGHVRFRQGKELLKGESAREPLIDRATTATEEGGDAISNADRALNGDDVMAMLQAYMNGRATRKQLRLANEDVQRALDLYGSVLVRWRRSVGDFRSADEMRTDADSQHNAKAVERHIEELLKHVQKLQEQKMELNGARGELKKKLSELRKKIPNGMMQPGQGEGDEEDEEEDRGQPKPESGFQDKGGPEGEHRGITPEIAQQILEALGLKGDRKLPLGGEGESKPRDRKGKDW